MRAPAPACSLARALRALAGGLSKERLGRLALLGNASEIQNAPGSFPELTLALLGLLFALLGVIWGLLRVIWGLLGLSWALLGRSWGALGPLSGAPGERLGAPKNLPNPSRRLSRRPPAPELDFGSMLAPFWGSFWHHFGTPRTSKNKVFVWKVLHFSKNREGSKKDLKSETWLSRNGKRVRSGSRKHRKRRRRRGDEHKQRREEPRQSTKRHSREFLVRLFRSSLARCRGRLRKHASPSASL